MGKCFPSILLILSSFSLFSGEANTEMMTWGPRAPAAAPIASMENNMSQSEPCVADCIMQSLANHVQIGGNYTYAHVRPNGLASTSGSLGGLQALYEYRTPCQLYGGVAFMYRQGDTDGSGGGRTILEFDVQERIGYTLARLVSDWTLSLFTGFGYRHYGEKVSSTGTSVTFNYNELYVPVGFLLDKQLSSGFCMGLNFQWMPQVYPTVTIVPLKGARWILTNELANFRIELPLCLAFGCMNQFAVTLQPFFEYWRDGHTTAKSPLGTALDA